MTGPSTSGARAPRLLAMLFAILLVGATACTERLEIAGPCPDGLCPEQQISVQEITIDAVSLAASIAGIPASGQEPLLLVARSGDTLDTRAVYRFDFIQRGTLPPGQGDTLVFEELFDPQLVIVKQRVASELTAPATLAAYHVDLEGDERGTTELLPLFTPARRLGALALQPPAAGDTALVDTLRIPLDPEALLGIFERAERVRIGLRLEEVDVGRITLSPVQAAITFRATEDTADALIITPISSATPVGEPLLARDLQSFTIIAAGTPPPTAAVIAVGGLPSRRALLRFVLPPVVDSSTVVRATLILQQVPSPSYQPTDSVPLGMLAITVGDVVTDIQRQVQLAGNPASPFTGRFIFPQTPRMIAPGRADTVELAITELIAAQARLGRPGLPPYLVLWSFDEGVSPAQVLFHSAEAAPELRPRIRLSFVRPVNFALP